jgi:hypothetical protein
MKRDPIVVLRSLDGWPPPRRRRRIGPALLVALLILVATEALWFTRAGAQEVDDARYQPSARGTRSVVTRWRPALEQYDDWDVAEGLRVIDCESGGDPGAVNQTSGATGLTQLLGWGWLARRLFGSADLTEPSLNLAVAHVLWLDSGGTFRWHWHASVGCWS